MKASASAALRPVLTGEPVDLRVVAVFPAAVYLAAAETGRVELTVVAADGIAHPNAVVVERVVGQRPFAGVRDLDRVTCGGHRVTGPWGAIAVGRWWSPRPVLPPVSPTPLAESVRSATVEVATLAPPLTRCEARAFDSLVAAVSSGHDGDACAAVDRLLGLGAGLTPTGDDLLAGFVAAIRSVEPRMVGMRSPALGTSLDGVVSRVEARCDAATTAISAALLRCAGRGALCSPASSFLRALVTGATWGPDLGALLRVGGTSGRDLALGLLGGLRCLTTSAERSPTLPGQPPLPVPSRRT